MIGDVPDATGIKAGRQEILRKAREWASGEVSWQIDEAKMLLLKHKMNNDPVIFAAVLQALATTRAAQDE